MATFSLPLNFQDRPVAVIGAGVLGRRIGCVWAAAGFRVRLRDPSEEQREGALAYARENLAMFAQNTLQHPSSDIKSLDSLAEVVGDAWLVIEAVPEHLDLKIDTFADLERLAPEDAILATNSSSYKSSQMLGKVSDATKTRILNMHYYMPPTAMTVELMTDGHTRADIITFLVEQCKKAALIPIVARKESTGLVFNRIWAAVKREVLTVLADGVAGPEDIDFLWKVIFHSSGPGPCEMMDGIGLDTVSFIESHYIAERGLSPEKTVDFLEDNYIKEGKLGAKSCKGGIYPPAKKSTLPEKKIYVLDLGLSALNLSKTGGRILQLSQDGRQEKVLVSDQCYPDGLAADVGSGRLFWTNMGFPGEPTGTVNSSNLDGSDVRIIVPLGNINTPKQLALDRTAKKVYFCDREGLRVYRCNYDGSALEAIVISGDATDTNIVSDARNWCVGIAVAPSLGKFYWTQKGAPKSGQGRIFGANMDLPAGATVASRPDIVCMLKDLPEPIDLDIDEKKGILYWTDRGELPFGNSFNRAQLDETGSVPSAPHEVLARNFNEAIGLYLDLENSVAYVADMGGSVYRVGLDGQEKRRLFLDDSCAFSALVAL